MPKQEKPSMMTAPQVAELFEVNVKTVNDWIHSENTPFPGAYKISDKPNSPWLIPTVEVEAYKKARNQSKN